MAYLKDCPIFLKKSTKYLSGKPNCEPRLKCGATKYQPGVLTAQQQCLVYTVYSVFTISKSQCILNILQHFTKSHNYKINEHKNEHTYTVHTLQCKVLFIKEATCGYTYINNSSSSVILV